MCNSYTKCTLALLFYGETRNLLSRKSLFLW